MIWTTPKYPPNEVNRAGRILVNNESTPEEIQWAKDVLNNWRSCHAYPINTFQATLRDKLKSMNAHAVVAQRLKRFPSIIGKLKRPSTITMRLSQMQDIGGLRAVVPSLQEVRALQNKYLKGRFNHELVRETDYIDIPTKLGYRSVHLIYRYRNKRAPSYDGLLLELQIRTQLQHTWATAVETVGTFLDRSLKSSEGPQKWLSFFSMVSSAFAHIEGTRAVPGYENLSQDETFVEVEKTSIQMRVRHRLQAFTVVAEAISDDKQSGNYHLVVLDPQKKSVTIRSFGRSRLGEANMEYAKAESRISHGEQILAVLVSAGSIDTLKRAYPNYFLDTQEFIRQLDSISGQIHKGK